MIFALCRILSMARFASEAELESFLGRLDPDYSQFANATKPLLLSWGLPELYIDDIKATTDRTGELNALSAGTLCLIVHRCCVHRYCLMLSAYKDWVLKPL